MNERWNVPGKYLVSPFNYVDEVVSDYEFPEKVAIWDCTIMKMDRTPGNRIYSVEEKLEIAAMLDDMGVAGLILNPHDFVGDPMDHPARNKAITDGIRAIANKGFGYKLAGVSRFPVFDGAYKEQMDRVIDLGIDLIYVHVPPQWRWPAFLPDWPWERIQDQATQALDYLKSQRVEVGVSSPDIVRVDPEEAVQILNYFINQGAESLHTSDTYGNLSPQGTRYLFKTLGKLLVRKVPLVYHCHNDFGMATAQVIAAIAAGASPETCVNGIGDRAFANMDEVVLSLELLYGANTGIKMEKLTEISQLVERITGIRNQPHKPVVGEAMYVPLFESDYIGAFRGDPYEYTSFVPELVGQRPALVWWEGMLSTRSVRAKLEQLGLVFQEEHVAKVKETVGERLGQLNEFPAWLPEAEVEEICRQVVG